ncbi:putative toxin-antitoxin system toxin component, PIN family [Nibrella viscosa]
MRIVLDTNAVLAALPKSSRYRLIINELVEHKFELVVSTAILLEYQEVISNKTNDSVAFNFLEFLTKQPSVIQVEPPFFWWLIKADPDDNKFVDAALIAGADYIVTNDAHFKVLKDIPFPSVNVISLPEFWAMLNTQ